MEFTTVGEINEYRGSSVTPSRFPDTVFETYSVPIFETGHPEYLTGDQIASSKQCVEKNDILLCKINPRINRVWVVADESDYQNIASSEWIVVRSSKYNPEYLAWYFRSKKFQTLMVSEVTGIGGSLTRAQPKRVATYPVPIVERNQQDYIATTLNEIASAISEREKQLDDLDLLIKSHFIEMFGEPIANQMHWPVKHLKDMSTLITNGTTPKGGSSNYVASGIMFLRSQNVWRNKIVLDDVPYIDEATHSRMKKSSLHHKDILITKTGRINTENSSLGRAALFLGEDNSANINGHVYLVRLDGSVVSFLHALCSSGQVSHCCVGMTVMPTRFSG